MPRSQSTTIGSSSDAIIRWTFDRLINRSRRHEARAEFLVCYQVSGDSRGQCGSNEMPNTVTEGMYTEQEAKCKKQKHGLPEAWRSLHRQRVLWSREDWHARDKRLSPLTAHRPTRFVVRGRHLVPERIHHASAGR